VATAARDREALEQAIVRGSELLKQGKLDHAQRAFRAALDIEADNPRVLALLGLTHFRANEFDEARPIYEDLVELAPTDASHRLNLGLVYLKLNNAELAITSLEASRALDPSQGRAISYLGLAYARAGRYAEAYRSFLIAGQHELATEIETNLPAAEREAIHVQIGRTPTPPAPAISRTATPPAISRTATPPAISRTGSEPRTKPPSAPPGAKPRATTSDVAQQAAAAMLAEKNRISAVEISVRPAVPRDADVSAAEVSNELGNLFDDAAPTPRPTAPPARPSPAPLPRPTPVPIAAAAIPTRRPPSMSESQQFVLPKAFLEGLSDATPQPLDGRSMVSLAVAAAVPAPTGAARTLAGGLAPAPLSELATIDLVRPDEGNDAFEIAQNGTLIIRVTDRVLTRLGGVHITGGELAFEPALRRSRGHQTDEAFDPGTGGPAMHAVSGNGYLIAVPPERGTFVAIALDDDILYVREDLVFGFQAGLRWENGNVPGLRGKLHVVQFRGDGALALLLRRPLVRIKLPPQGLVFVDADRLAGWIGRVIPRAVVPPSGGPMGTMCVECTGEGIVLVEPGPLALAEHAALSANEPPPLLPPDPVPETPEAPPEIAPEVADFAADLAAHNAAEAARDEI
jgi:tetratricopeptide (TPR) repeat protein